MESRAFFLKPSSSSSSKISQEKSTKCGRRRCTYFNGNCDDSSDDEFVGDSPPIAAAGSGDALEIIKGLVPCESLSERNLLADASKIVETNKTKIGKGKDVCIKFVTENLQSLGYDASICKSKWDKTPFDSSCIMNLIGVLKFKKMGEDFVRNSGLPYTIIKAGRLTDGPYTSYDLNTLIKATAGERRAVVIGQGDKLVGEVSRLVVVEACIQALDIDFTKGQISTTRKRVEFSSPVVPPMIG